MDKDKLMARLTTLPAPDFMHVHKLSDPIGAGSSYRADTVARLIDEAVAAERERCAAYCESTASEPSEGKSLADDIRSGKHEA